jgi:hypothetical protein
MKTSGSISKYVYIYLLHWSTSFDSCQSILDVIGNTCVLSVWANLKGATTSTEFEISNFSRLCKFRSYPEHKGSGFFLHTGIHLRDHTTSQTPSTCIPLKSRRQFHANFVVYNVTNTGPRFNSGVSYNWLSVSVSCQRRWQMAAEHDGLVINNRPGSTWRESCVSDTRLPQISHRLP